MTGALAMAGVVGATWAAKRYRDRLLNAIRPNGAAGGSIVVEPVTDAWYVARLRAFSADRGHPAASRFQVIFNAERAAAVEQYGANLSPYDEYPAAMPYAELRRLCEAWEVAAGDPATVFMDERAGGKVYRNDRESLTAAILKVTEWKNVHATGGNLIPAAQSTVATWRAIGMLSMAIDAEGVLEWGADYATIPTLGESFARSASNLPETLSEVGSAVVGAVGGLAGDAAGAVAGAAARVVFSPIGAAAVLGYLIVRAS